MLSIATNVMRKEILDKYLPNSDGLLSDLSISINDSMLKEIANADYGSDFKEHLSKLKSIRDKNEIPVPLRWHPREVLELIRWSEPDDPKWKPGSTGFRGHLMRAFCCAALLRSGVESQNRDYLEGENQTIAQLLESLRVIDSTYSESAIRFFAYQLLNYDKTNKDSPFYILGFLILVLRNRKPVCDKDIDEIVSWLIQEEARIRAADWSVIKDDEPNWLLGLTFHDLKNSVWRAYAEELSDMACSITNHKTRERVLEVGSMLAHNKQRNTDSGADAPPPVR